MRFHEIITEGRDAILWHGYSGLQKVRHAEQALAKNEMAATSTQRWWPDGRRRKENDPDYRDSYWMKGVSLSRDPKYAMGWGNVVFALDQRKIAQRYKIIPFNWGYSIPSGNHHKREREEFVAVKRDADTYNRPEEDGGGFDTPRFMADEGYALKPLSAYLLGIYVSVYLATEMPDTVTTFIAHPLFRGYYLSGNNATGQIISPNADLSQFKD